jgi:hypothetical protein
MITVSVKINRPSNVVWDYFTTTSNWRKWHGGAIKEVVPTWKQGAKLVWELGGSSTIIKFISGKEVCSSSTWMDTTYQFIQRKNSITIVKIIESDPKGGASFNDGGAAHKADLEHNLQKFKKFVEEETNAISVQGKKWWEIWK